MSSTLAGAAVLSGCGAAADAFGSGGLSEAEKSRVAEAYRDCMADAGLEGEVSYSRGGIDVSSSGSADSGMTEEQYLAVEVACERLLAPLDDGEQIDPADEARMIEASADLERCLTDKGFVVSVVDGAFQLNSQDQNGDFDEAEYYQAEEDCVREVVPDLYEKYGEGN